MKICKVVIENYQQFKHLELDFTHPETGEPLDKICFIGSNGTGKSTLLDLLLHRTVSGYMEGGPICSFEFVHQGNYYVWEQTSNHIKFITRTSDSFDTVGNLTIDPKIEGRFHASVNPLLKTPYVAVKVNAESDANNYKQVYDVPLATLNEAFKSISPARYYPIDQSNVGDFWKCVIYHTAQRERARIEFENDPENLEKTKRQLIEEFDAANPKILDRLADIWNSILEKAGLEFDVANAKLPIQLTDNLHAYIRLKATGERINYNQLSTGIRNFIFRIGHIYSLYFNREIENGFLFVDEPENSLFPDFLLDLIEIYEQVTTDKNGHRNTQMFFATHNPIVAAQFQPYERVILEWAEDGSVTARRGSAPVGDDPNDVLIKDFEISSLMPQAGVAMWEKYLDLKRKLRQTTDETQKETLVTEILEIGQEYNFPRDQPKP